MQINGQGAQEGSSVRWSTRLRSPFMHGNASNRRAVAARSQNKKRVGESPDSNKSLSVKANHAAASDAGEANFKRQSAVLLIVLFIHAAGLYQMAQIADIKMPAVSVPLQISFALSEPVQAKPKIKPEPKPKPQALAEEPVPVEKPPEETQPQVTPPDYKVAHLNNPAPDYPPLSRRLKEQGDVILRVYVTPQGAPGEIQLHTSSGYPRLDRAAQEAVERWKFLPARRGEDPVGAWVLVTINYVLS